jgi:hypothetical protein
MAGHRGAFTGATGGLRSFAAGFRLKFQIGCTRNDLTGGDGGFW